MIRSDCFVIFSLFSLFALVEGGCATVREAPQEEKPLVKAEIPPSLPPRQRHSINIAEIQAYINQGRSRDVRVPRAILKEWLALEKQREMECRNTEDQLQALKAIDMEKWSYGKSEQTDSARR